VYASVIPAWLGALLRNQTAYINGDGSISRDFCHVDNVVQANLLAALSANPAAVNQAYNVAHGEQTTLNELFELMRLLMLPRLPHMKTVRAVHRAPRRGDLPRSLASIDKAAKLLGYKPSYNLRTGLQQTIDWYAENLAHA
jgi:UDP-N-acetylglucosamine 4-epimerase